VLGGVEYIDQRPLLERGDASNATRVAMFHDATSGVRQRAQCGGELHRDELGPAEAQRAGPVGEIGDAVRYRVRLAVKLQAAWYATTASGASFVATRYGSMVAASGGTPRGTVP
jgi:hypothetical protein